MDFHSKHLDSIQALRGISALFILLEHIRFLNCGAFGVDIFFCISGFMIMFSTHKSASHFLSKRLIRILPFYYLMTLGTYLVLLFLPGMFSTTVPNPVFLVKSLLFIPFDIGEGALQPLMRVGWTVNCEIFFYLMFFLALRISHKYRGLICGGLIALVVALANLLRTDFAPLRFYGDPVMLDFIWGILAYYICRSLYNAHVDGKLKKFFGPLALILGLFCFLMLLILKPSANAVGFRRPLVWGLPALMIVLCFFVAGLFLKMPDAFVKLGDISFSLYLIHYYPITFLDRKVFDFGNFSPLALFGVAISIAICIVLALICHALIERGLTNWLRKKMIK